MVNLNIYTYDEMWNIGIASLCDMIKGHYSGSGDTLGNKTLSLVLEYLNHRLLGWHEFEGYFKKYDNVYKLLIETVLQMDKDHNR